MELKSNLVNEFGKQNQSVSQALGASLHDFNEQCLRVLRCTAQAMVSSPGGLRFKAGTRPWLEGLPVSGLHAQALSVIGPVIRH